MDDPYGATTWRFRRFSPLAAATSGLLHAATLAAVLPEALPQRQHARTAERMIELTFDLPAPRAEAVAPDPAQQDAADTRPAAPQPDLARTLAPPEAPQPLSGRELGVNAPRPEAESSLDRVLPPVAEPPSVTGREIAQTPPAAQTRAPPPPPPIRQEKTRRPPRQQAAEQTERAAGAVSEDGNRRAQQDYLWQIIGKLSQYRFYQSARGERPQGVVVTRLTLARDGRLLDVSLVSSSGSPNLDRGVIDTIRSASPFAPFPAEMTVDHHTFTVPIGYAREP